MSSHELYGTWCKIHQRCYSPKSPNYSNYGGRGIKMSEEWEKSPTPFITWAERNGWYKGCGLTVDRIDVNGDYSEENCRLATISEQNRNKRNNRFITFNGETLTITDWANRIGITTSVLSKRLSNPKWTFEDAMTKPADAKWNSKGVDDYNMCEVREQEITDYKNKVKLLERDLAEDIQPRPNISENTVFEFNSVGHTVKEWAEFMGMKPHVLLRRLKLGWSMHDALFLSPRRRSEGTS